MRDFIVASPQQTKFQASINDFRNARQRAALESIVNRLTGKSTELLSYEQVISQLKVVGQSQRGVQEIPVEAIVGSVGRYSDFTRTFLPQRESDAQRWAKVASLSDFDQLPPIEVYQVGDKYFVLDGNHRVSIARQRGVLSIPAEVTEVKTRALIPPNVSPDKLILQAEYAAFLEHTNLDRLRPEAGLTVSVPGQYRKLENHMEVHRFFIEMADDIELSDAEAVTRWYDEAYLPAVQAVREQGILRGFPNRTETDLYLWISKHQARLRNELGWRVRPEVATADLANRFDAATENTVTRIGKKFGRGILNLVVPEGAKPAAQTQSWSQSKVAARYSDRLFADLLVILREGWENRPVLEQALIIAQRDDAKLHGLHSAAEGAKILDSPLKKWFESQRQSVEIEGRLAAQTGDLVQVICERAALVDLIVCGRFPLEPNSELEPTEQLLNLIRQSPRPVLIATETAVPLNNILLAYDGGAKSKEALFAAAYMAERWGATLTVALAPEAGSVEDAEIAHARTYLEMHEVTADYVVCEVDPISLILDTAKEKEAQLIVAGGYSERRFGRRGPGDVVNRLVTEWPGALLICP